MATSTHSIGKFGTAPVFFTAISTILGAILFLRFGFAVGQAGFLGTLAIVLIGHAVTIPTAMAIAEIATNQKVEGGGEYYIISRSFGLVIGATIGIALYLSQAISVAFYIIAFSEAFTSFFTWLGEVLNFPTSVRNILTLNQIVGIPALLGLTYIMLTKGARLGVAALYVVVTILGIAIISFFLGETVYASSTPFDPMATIQDSSAGVAIAAVPFFTVFAIIFPAFTGMTAGVGLSGDLKEPGKSIPLGTMAGTLFGMVVYVLIAYKLASSAPPEQLVDTSRLVMSDIAWQGWLIIPIGLAAATISSALGSIMVAPRTLQAIAKDRIFPMPKINNWLMHGRGKSKEPYNASIITIIIAGAFILLGALDGVAKIISMFFMVTYGSLCLISFLNHFAADPSYRPRFKSRWYISLFGAIACFGLMFLMNPSYAIVALIIITTLHLIITYYNRDKNDLAAIFQGVIFQFSRTLQVFLQKAKKEQIQSWRPSAVVITQSSFQRLGSFDLLSWIAHKYGFGTYIHFINGYLSKETNAEANECKERLISMAGQFKSNIFIDTLVSPSYTSAIAQVIQLPGISGTENNLLILEFSKTNPEHLEEILGSLGMVRSTNFDVILLASSDRGFGHKQNIHVWITPKDYENANLMILLAYILLGHPMWRRARIKLYAMFPEEELEKEHKALLQLIADGQLPISSQNIEFIPKKTEINTKKIICQRSADADLIVLGFREEAVKHYGISLFEDYDDIGNILFVNAGSIKTIVKEFRAGNSGVTKGD